MMQMLLVEVELVQFLKVFSFVSQAEDAKTSQGGTNYYVNVINRSEYVRWTEHDASLD